MAAEDDRRERDAGGFGGSGNEPTRNILIALRYWLCIYPRAVRAARDDTFRMKQGVDTYCGDQQPQVLMPFISFTLFTFTSTSTKSLPTLKAMDKLRNAKKAAALGADKSRAKPCDMEPNADPRACGGNPGGMTADGKFTGLKRHNALHGKPGTRHSKYPELAKP
ncbi:hypothetical protein CCM_04005 [Cordyceps militaris CM01]|uniref:Uncharacterized protein n=1 Tax=Cordyceps militaris (strain CM01) TaxID=983644 RepID=G3JDF7_CORMM|nr:uncharacterized protein CCM_04005 [Cordyceps militaris CM01]EGX92632.1 hypothetical protein CCM_04005 [Cordyceps militaris CM01]